MNGPWELDQKLLWRERPVTVKDRSSGSTIIVQNDDGGELLQVPTSELMPRARRSDPALATSLMTIDQSTWDHAASRAATLRMIIGAGDRSESVRHGAAELGISERQLWRLVRQFETGGESVTTLLPKSRGRRKGCRMLSAEGERLIVDALDEHYLRKEKPSLAYLQERVAGICREKGLKPIGRDALRRRIEGLGRLQVARRRLGSKKAKALLAPAPEHCTATRPLELVQMDHTLVDIVLVSEDGTREVIGRPWLTVAIDVFTRMVVGFHVTFDAPSAVSVALCLTQAILPKDSLLVHLGVQGEWPCCGRMTVLLMDNAREFHSKALERGADEQGIELRYRPVATPHYGGHIERLIGTLMGYCHLLPGTTQSNVGAKGDYDSEAHACMTLTEFRTWLTMQIVNGYHLKKHRSIEIPPIVAWNEAGIRSASAVPATQVAALELLVTFLPAETRKVHRTGLQLWTLHYWAPALRDFLDHGESCLVHYDPRDISRVYVRARNGVLVEASVTEEGFEGISLAEHRHQREARKKLSQCPRLLLRRDASAKASDELIAKALAETRRVRRKPKAKTKTETRSQQLTTAAPAWDYTRPLVRLLIADGSTAS